MEITLQYLSLSAILEILMSVLIDIQGISKSWGSHQLFKKISFSVHQKDRLALIGPNGSGKSTLLKILADLETPDEGKVCKRQGLRVGYCSQTPTFSSTTIWNSLLNAAPNRDDAEVAAAKLLSQAHFNNPDQLADTLSGGWKKRLDLLAALIQEPDILLLDEPTNHLDLEGILFLEKFLKQLSLPYVIISHDRYFLERVTNKTMELNPCFPAGLFIQDGSWSTFIEQKALFLIAQQEQERALSSTMRHEVDWMRRSPKARTTKSQSRVQRAEALIETVGKVHERNQQRAVKMEFVASERQTLKLLVGNNLTKSYANHPLFRALDLTITPGKRIGIIGKNGTGKSTLLKILAGQISPDKGNVKTADDLQVVYFDQHRQQINDEITLKEALSPLGDYVQSNGEWIHVNGWAKRFLFTPDRLVLPVKVLSGGERARILLAQLMLKPADLLILDEPTNDLDIPTLQMLEENLLNFPGGIVMVCHDRCLMDRVCNEILVLDHEGHHFFADYLQYERTIKEETPKGVLEPKEKKSQPITQPKVKKLSYNEQRELAMMEEKICSLEEQLAAATLALEDPDIATNSQRSSELCAEMAVLQEEINRCFERWQILTS